MKTGKLIRVLSVILIFALMIQIFPMTAFAESLTDDLAQNETVSEEITDNAEETDIPEQEDPEEIPPEIVAEDLSRREETVKHFRMSDGTMQALQYAEPVHYLKDGEWVDYDNSFSEVSAVSEDGEEIEKSGTDYANKSADYSVRFSKKTNGKKFVRFEKDGYKLSWYYLKANKAEGQVSVSEDDGDPTTLENISSEVIYKNVYENVDLQYIAAPTGIKENIILNSADVQTEFIAEYKANGLSPVQVSDQIIELRTEDGTVVYTVSAPFMYDADGEISESVTLSLTEVKNNKFTVKITVDAEWLSAEERVFPVVVDPAIQTEQKTAVMDSAFVAKGSPTKCYYAYGLQHDGEDSGSLYVGNMGGSYGLTQSYLKFDKLPMLSVADKVVEAQLQIVLYKCENGLQLDVKKVTSAWDTNKVTWNTKPSVDNTVLDYKILTNSNDSKWLNFEITDLVRGWYSGEYTNHGISLSTDKTASAKAWIFSSRFDENAQKQYRPILRIRYRNMSGFEDYWSYTSLPAGRNGSVSVNNFNGNLVFTQPVTQDCGGNLMPVDISLVYNSNGPASHYTYLGKQMQTNYHIYLRYDSTTAANKYKYYLNDADGTRHWFWFENSASKTGKDEDGLGYTLDLLHDNPDSACTAAKFRITDKNKNKMYFDERGNIIRLTNANGVSANIQYKVIDSTNIRIESVTDGAGRVYKYGYDSDTSILCTSITDPAGRKTSFEYWQGGMTAISFPDGKKYNLVFGDNGILNQIKSIDGTRTLITTDSSSQKRVTSIKWGNDSASPSDILRYSFTYKQNETYVTDRQGRKFTYQFNNCGQTTGIISNADGSAQFFERVENDNTNDSSDTNKTDVKANKLLSSSKVLKSVANYIVNPGFTRDYSNGFWTYAPDTTGTPTIAIDTAKGNLTSNSLKVYKPSNNTKNVMTVQNVSGISAGTYTLSAYVNTNNVTVNGNGVYLGVELRNSAGAMVKVLRAEKIYKTSGWERISLTFDLPADQTLTVVSGFDAGGSGTVWLDDFQLEQGTGVSSCNLVENSSFLKGTSAWTYADGVAFGTLSGNLSYLGKYAHIAGDAANKKAIRSDVVSSGKKGDVFCIGGWMKANSAPTNNGMKDDDAHQPNFGMWVDFINGSGKSVGGKMLHFNADVKDWQFSSAKFIAPADYAKVLVYFSYEYNVNAVDVAGMFCYKEEFGQTYDYDKDGNIASVVDITKTNSAFAFKNNLMTQLTNPSGSKYFYSYAYNEADLSEAVSTDGQRYSFTYDDKGNVLTSKVEADKYVTSVKAGGKYIIRNAESGNVLDNGDNKGTAYNWRYRYGNPNQIWELVATDETDVYYLKSLSYGELYIGVKNNSNTDGADFCLSKTPSGDSFKFKIYSHADGTFFIVTKTSGYKKCIDGQPNNSKDYADGSALKQWTHYYQDKSQSWYFYPDITSASGATQQKYMSSSATYTANKNFLNTVTDQAGNKTTYAYNQSKGTLTSVTDAKNQKTSYLYDANTNALTTVTSGGMSVNYSYTNDRLININVNNGTKYKFDYDLFGRRTATYVGNGTDYTKLSAYSYDMYGRLQSQTYGNGDAVSYVYDTLDRITQKSQKGAVRDTSIYYHYGSDGNLSYSVDMAANATTKYVYDLAGRLVGTKEYAGSSLSSNSPRATVDYTYADKTNYLTRIKHDSDLGQQSVSYKYGSAFLGEMHDALYSIDWNEKAAELRYSYDELGRLSGKNIVIGAKSPYLNTSYTYKAVSGNQTSNLVSSMNTLVGKYYYRYDKLGNITYVDDLDGEITYEYDSLNQLVRENNDVVGKTYTYSYKNGNITERKEYEYTEDKTLPETPLSTKTWSYTSSKWGDVLTKFNNDNISTDAIGNPKVIGSNVLTWKGRQLQSIGFTYDPDYITYEYDMEGRRIAKDGPGGRTEFYYNGNILAGQKNGTTKIVFMYDEKGDPFGFKYNDDYYAYIKNLQNDVVAIADKDKNIVVRYTYDSWGKLLKTEGTLADTIGKENPIRYRSYYYDTESKYYFLQSRYYDPDMCRFLNADDSEILLEDQDNIVGYNIYSYCLNNPITMYDPDGYSATLVLTGGGAVASWLAGLGSANFWNPLGWAILGVLTVTVVVGVGYKIYQSTKSNSDPYARPGQKKQGRERKNKARQKDNWKPKSKAKPPKKHTPGRDHRRK